VSEIVGILSGKGGVGKTSLVANLGAALTGEFKRSAVIVDANANSSHLGLHLGIYEDLPVTMRDLLKKNMSVEHALYLHPSTGIKIVPAPIAGGVTVSASRLRSITSELARKHDVVILDCPPGLGKEVVAAVSAIDAGIIITTPDFPAVADALKTVRLLERMKKRVIGLVVNRRRGERYELTVPEIESTCGVPVIATIPDDVRVTESVSEGTPVVLLCPYSRASHSFKRLAGKLVGEEYKPKGILSRICDALYRRPSGQIEEVPKVRPTTHPAGSPPDVIRGQLREDLKREVVSRVRERLAREKG